MPLVTLVSTNGHSHTESGGCFGFTGRSNSWSFGNHDRFFTNGGKIDIFRYHFGKQWASKSLLGLYDPRPYLKWVCDESSWAKYVRDYSFEEGDTWDHNNNLQNFINIRCDIPGHCVVGTASALRLASHRAKEFLPYWNASVAMGVDGGVALLVFYAMYSTVSNDMQCDAEGLIARSRIRNNPINIQPTCHLSLSDDEVMKLDNVDPGLLASFALGDFEMIRNDQTTSRTQNEELYETRPNYQQNIIQSFRADGRRTNRKNFGSWLVERFHTTLSDSDVQGAVRSSGSMGSTDQRVAIIQSTVFLSATIGWASILTNELKSHGRLLGWRSQ